MLLVAVNGKIMIDILAVYMKIMIDLAVYVKP